MATAGHKYTTVQGPQLLIIKGKALQFLGDASVPARALGNLKEPGLKGNKGNRRMKGVSTPLGFRACLANSGN